MRKRKKQLYLLYIERSDTMKKWLLGAIALLVLLLLWSLYIYKEAMNGKTHGEAHAIEMAKKNANLVSITRTDYYHGYKKNLSYTVVEGSDAKRKQWIVLVPEKDDEKVLTVKQKDAISAKQALESIMKDSEVVGNSEKPKEIIKMKMGAEKNVSLWEITYVDVEDRYSFCYVDLKTGRVLRLYTLQK